MLDILGVETLLNDPPLADQGDSRDLRELDEVLEADVVTLHVPFATGGDHPTADLLNAGRLMRMKRGACLINTARGGVVDESSLKNAMATRELRGVLDVWRHEPAIDSGLAAAVMLGTPHIAGYSLDAKLRATADGLPGYV
ncbi:MAG: NAD(P)-dependent oxidoreductase [Gammaproteobacteria bacterium]|nr:NAD(P)-dependent oxidoreductase [Gammaproteobacteria bacterium]